ncbi:hypothetical protein FQA47_013482 [Oryzias melastigma]|uniref:Uncharacterized protein n=1 Tax=Oryzias melastigma TaxID=30732 RepID=A0A834FIJ1_ORYME|nr:hypothetical protein FQA47_013482 [Oryzias melastigma]
MVWTGGSHVCFGLEHFSCCDSTLCRLFGLDLPEPKRGVVVELYVQAVLFGRKQSFKKEQTSSLLSIIKSIHEANVGKQKQGIYNSCAAKD